MSDSTWDDPRITGYVLDELSDDDRAAFESEMNSQSELAAAVEEARRVTSRIEALFEQESTPNLDDSRRNAIIEGTKSPLWNNASDSGGHRTKDDAIYQAPSWGVPAAVLAIAAALLLLIGVAPWRNQEVMVTAIAPADKSNENEVLLAQTDRSDRATEANQFDARQFDAANDFAASENAAGKVMASESLMDMDNAVDIDRSVAATAPQIAMAPAAMGSADLALTTPTDSASKTNLLAGASTQQADAELMASAIPSASSLGLPELGSFDGKDDLMPSPSVDLLADANVGRRSLQRSASGQTSSLDRARARIAENLGMPAEKRAARSKPKAKSAAINAPQPQAAAASRGMAGSAAGAPPSQLSAKAGTAKAASGRSEESSSMSPEVAMLFAGQNKKTADSEEDAVTNVDVSSSKIAQTFAWGGPIAIGDVAAVNNETNQDFKDELRALNERFFGSARERGRSNDQQDRSNQRVIENDFLSVAQSPLSGFSASVGSISYRITRDALMRSGTLPRPADVRIEELTNYFDYDYTPSAKIKSAEKTSEAKHPFSSYVDVTDCPWTPDHRLARIAIQGNFPNKTKRADRNWVFLLDTSGSMDAPNKLVLFVDGIKRSLKELTAKDRIAIVVYSDSEGLVLDSTPADKTKRIERALSNLVPSELADGESVDDDKGLQLAFRVARANFIKGGVNRVILCTDSNFNAGMSDDEARVSLITKAADDEILLTTVGIGIVDRTNALSETTTGEVRRRIDFVDSPAEANRVLAEQGRRAPKPIAQQVQIELEFNPLKVSQYRLIGYENGDLAASRVDDNADDANRFAAGQSITALYEIVPARQASKTPSSPGKLKYQQTPVPTQDALSDELLTLNVRYQRPGKSKELAVQFTAQDSTQETGGDFEQADPDFKFATAVTSFAMQLRGSKYAGDWTLDDAKQVAQESLGDDALGLRKEFLQMIDKAAELSKSK